MLGLLLRVFILAVIKFLLVNSLVYQKDKRFIELSQKISRFDDLFIHLVQASQNGEEYISYATEMNLLEEEILNNEENFGNRGIHLHSKYLNRYKFHKEHKLMYINGEELV